jgi:hypothetical protein
LSHGLECLNKKRNKGLKPKIPHGGSSIKLEIDTGSGASARLHGSRVSWLRDSRSGAELPAITEEWGRVSHKG